MNVSIYNVAGLALPTITIAMGVGAILNRFETAETKLAWQSESIELIKENGIITRKDVEQLKKESSENIKYQERITSKSREIQNTSERHSFILTDLKGDQAESSRDIADMKNDIFELRSIAKDHGQL